MTQQANGEGRSIELEHPVFFCGGVPADTVEEVFRTLASGVGPRALAYPDGEINDRRYWIAALPDATYEKSAQLAHRPSPYGEDDRRKEFYRSFAVREGVSEVDLRGLLPYSGAALASYEIFKGLKADGVIDPGMRFQVATPSAFAAVARFFAVKDWPVMFRAWVIALQDEHRRILEAIPHHELVVQIDYCSELGIILGLYAELDDVTTGMTGDAALAKYTAPDYLEPHLAAVPDDVMAGYHICLGTFPEWPVMPIPDIGLPVDLANRLAANSGRRIDFFHLPAMSDSTAEYFAPLEQLDVGDAAIYLGLECNDGLEAMQRRMSYAKRFRDRFGVAHYCGYMWNRDILPGLLKDLAAAADQTESAKTA
jgi:hypothetical protein